MKEGEDRHWWMSLPLGATVVTVFYVSIELIGRSLLQVVWWGGYFFALQLLMQRGDSIQEWYARKHRNR